MLTRRSPSGGLLAACLLGLVAICVVPASSASSSTYHAKFYVEDVNAKPVDGGKTKVSVKYRIKCPGNHFKAGIGFGDSIGNLYTIENGSVKQEDRVSKSFDLRKGVYTAGAAYVRCYQGDKYVGGAFPPRNKEAQQKFNVH